MPSREFLEEYPLYRKLKIDLPDVSIKWDRPAIHMFCHVCSSEQTFNMVNGYHEGYTKLEDRNDCSFRLIYQCSSCRSYCRYFFIRFNQTEGYVVKVGQQPAWDITPDPTVSKMLSAHADYYKKALICESQGYGIGAFAYYRRIIEEIIDTLLADIPELMTDEEKKGYLDALKQTKQTKVAEDKIALVKDLLPPILRPAGMNPLATLHSTLSKGLHQGSDEECMELAMQVREALTFLLGQITATKNASARFTDSMRKLLERAKK